MSYKNLVLIRTYERDDIKSEKKLESCLFLADYIMVFHDEFNAIDFFKSQNKKVSV